MGQFEERHASPTAFPCAQRRGVLRVLCLPLRKGRSWLFPHTPVNATTGDKALLHFCPVCSGSMPVPARHRLSLLCQLHHISHILPTSRIMPAALLHIANNSWLSPKGHRPLEMQPSQSSPVSTCRCHSKILPGQIQFIFH